MDKPTDEHRHLSHLVSMYPGYAISSFDPSLQASPKNYSRAQVLEAAKTSLIHRGNGTTDQDAGWSKVWRAAQWAQHGDADTFYLELTVSAYAMRLCITRGGGD
jgi:alpha-L-fucosidase 2